MNYAPREHLWSCRHLNHYDFKTSIVFMVPYIGEMATLLSKTYMWDTSGQDYKNVIIVNDATSWSITLESSILLQE